ncbi:MAG TPA: HEAT repeat domain-containing protein [Candidatus Rifleibacterium sp.]|nr:HEAT repeat domain-containing protein [Candidatus Rifleibacterium sp.]HPT44605.1 HEAT repeat domain-containing protein [Candidatus Rifleibacterium sp.]
MEDLQSLISELSAPVKTFRIFAIEKAIRTGAAVELQRALQLQRSVEEDSECQMLLDHAIASVEERLANRGQPQSKKRTSVSPDEFARMSAPEQLHAISRTPAATLKKDSLKTLQFLWQNATSAVVRAEIVKRCSQFWPEELVELLESNLYSGSQVLQIACLEAVITSFPERLQKHFDRLVMSPDPVVRATAIRGLARRHPQSAAIFLSQSLRKGDYYTRLAALRAISVMPFNLNRSSLVELLACEKDEKLLKIIAAIIISNPDREMPFRICDIIEKAPVSRREFLHDLQKNCCAMLKMAEICPDFQQYLATLKKYPNRLKARQFVQNCMNTWESADQLTRSELVILLREKMQVEEVKEAVTALAAGESSELLQLASEKPAIKAEPVATPEPGNEQNLLKRLLRIRIAGEKDAIETIETAFKTGKPSGNLLPAAFRAAVFCQDARWREKASAFLRSDNEDLVATALEYLSNFDNDGFMLQIRNFINSPSMVIRTALLRSLCRENPDSARQLLASMLNDKELKVRGKAISSLVHFEFAGIRDLLTAFLERENNIEQLTACLSFYLANPVMESVYDLDRLSRIRPTLQHVFEKPRESIRETLLEFNIASESDINSYLEKRRCEETEKKASETEAKETARLNDLAGKISWNSISDKLPDLSEFYPVIKKGFLAVMFLLALFFFLSGSGEETATPHTEGYTPVAAEITEFRLKITSISSHDGSILALADDDRKILALPRPGKAFVARPGDSITIRAMPFRILPDQTLAVKTIEVINSR